MQFSLILSNSDTSSYCRSSQDTPNSLRHVTTMWSIIAGIVTKKDSLTASHHSMWSQSSIARILQRLSKKTGPTHHNIWSQSSIYSIVTKQDSLTASLHNHVNLITIITQLHGFSWDTINSRRIFTIMWSQPSTLKQGCHQSCV